MLRILGICGSLRKGNALLLRAYAEWAPPDITIETARIDQIASYNEDIRQVGFPAPVARLRDQIQAADALLIVTPEYNYQARHQLPAGFGFTTTSVFTELAMKHCS